MADDDVSIVCEGLTKRYRIASADDRTAVLHRQRRTDFYALKDVSFEVARGEVMGVVGRNGAGKSTLLKVLSRIVRPTAGHAELNGRLAGLLEVGTGFHPELSGRDNIYLNGTVMGMTRREVRRHFDDIVEFAGVSTFLDTPIKRYSSGMYVRLAFAVAAHLACEILVLDEVLAVGDAAFQRKCLGKVQELSRSEGRTVLLVSHNAEIVRQQATRALRLERGQLTTIGPVADVLQEAEDRDSPFEADVGSADRVDANWGRIVRIVHIRLADAGHVPYGADLRYTLSVEVMSPVEFGVGQAVVTLDDAPVATSFSELRSFPVGSYELDVTVHAPPLAPGRYAMNVVVGAASFAAPDLHYDGVMHTGGFEVAAPDDTVMDWHPEWWGHVPLAAPTLTSVRRR